MREDDDREFDPGNCIEETLLSDLSHLYGCPVDELRKRLRDESMSATWSVEEWAKGWSMARQTIPTLIKRIELYLANRRVINAFGAL